MYVKIHARRVVHLVRLSLTICINTYTMFSLRFIAWIPKYSNEDTSFYHFENFFGLCCDCLPLAGLCSSSFWMNVLINTSRHLIYIINTYSEIKLKTTEHWLLYWLSLIQKYSNRHLWNDFTHTVWAEKITRVMYSWGTCTQVQIVEKKKNWKSIDLQ